MPMSGLAVVDRWLAALNARDTSEVLALSAPDVRLVGPRGVGVGRAVLQAWLTHAGATFHTRARFARGPSVVVHQEGVWHDPATGAAGGAVIVATRFRVAGAAVQELERYDTLAAALAAAELSETDRVRESPHPRAS